MKQKLYISELYDYIHTSQENREIAQIEKAECYTFLYVLNMVQLRKYKSGGKRYAGKDKSF